jgi:hypothetical protein
VALIEKEVGMAVAATAAALSPRAREVARRGAVYGLAGALKLGDVVVSTARGAARGAEAGISGSGNGSGRSSARGASRQRSSEEDPDLLEELPSGSSSSKASSRSKAGAST